MEYRNVNIYRVVLHVWFRADILCWRFYWWCQLVHCYKLIEDGCYCFSFATVRHIVSNSWVSCFIYFVSFHTTAAATASVFHVSDLNYQEQQTALSSLSVWYRAWCCASASSSVIWRPSSRMHAFACLSSLPPLTHWSVSFTSTQPETSRYSCVNSQTGHSVLHLHSTTFMLLY